MAIAFRAQSSGAVSTTFLNDPKFQAIVQKPSGVLTGDLMVVAIDLPTTINITIPTGWTQVRHVQGLAVYVKSATVNEPNTWTWQFAQGSSQTPSWWGWVCVAYSGAATAAPLVNVETGAQVIGAGTSITMASVNTTRANTMLLGILAGLHAFPAWNATPPGSMTERGEAAWSNSSNRGGVTVAEEAIAATGATGTRVFTTAASLIGGAYVILALSPPPPPTIVGVVPAYGGIDGDTPLTITGTGFASGATVSVKGVAATDVVVASDTVIFCRTGAGTAGRGDVVVNVSGDTATFTNGFTYFDVEDNSVKLVKAGSVAGDDKASAEQWPPADAVKVDGGATDLWGTTLTPEDVNDADFGVAISADVAGGQARIDAVRVQVNYSVPGVADPSTFLAVLRVASDKQTARPEIYRLPRAGLTVANDPNISKKRDTAVLRTSRYLRPARVIEKTYREIQLWLDATPQANTPGMQVWARLNDGTAFQLLDEDEAAVTLRTTGRHRLFFPKESTGNYCQVEFRIPEKTGSEIDVDASPRDAVLYGSYRLLSERNILATIVLGNGEHTDSTAMRRAADTQKEALEALVNRVVAYKDPWGNDGYLQIYDLAIREMRFREREGSAWVAQVRARTVPYA